ncbi:MAG: S1 RNA-binding domain-containing protein, partial [Ignavibacteriota bacterium]
MSNPNEETGLSDNAEISESPMIASTDEAAATQPDAPALDPFEKLRRSRDIINAKVIKWANNGLEVELDGGVSATMPNNHIDLDPDRNIAKYFGKTLPVRVVNLKMEHGNQVISVSHRSVLEDDLKKASKEKLEATNVGDVIEAKVKAFNIQDVLL